MGCGWASPLTPRSEGDRDTYALFGLEPNNPTYAYELEQAVHDGFVTPPTAISVPLRFHRQGIRYADLNAEERTAYEEQFADPVTGQFPEEIDAPALNKWLFNTDTVDKLIGYLMEHGIKVEKAATNWAKRLCSPVRTRLPSSSKNVLTSSTRSTWGIS